MYLQLVPLVDSTQYSIIRSHFRPLFHFHGPNRMSIFIWQYVVRIICVSKLLNIVCLPNVSLQFREEEPHRPPNQCHLNQVEYLLPVRIGNINV